MHRLIIIAIVMMVSALEAVEVQRITLADGRTVEGTISQGDRWNRVTIDLYFEGRQLGSMQVHPDDIVGQTTVIQTEPEPEPEPEPEQKGQAEERRIKSKHDLLIDELRRKAEVQAKAQLVVNRAEDDAQETLDALEISSKYYWLHMNASKLTPITEGEIKSVAGTGIKEIVKANRASEIINRAFEIIRRYIDSNATYTPRSLNNSGDLLARMYYSNSSEINYVKKLLELRGIIPPKYIDQQEYDSMMQKYMFKSSQ